jgi:hypothetical protein
VGELLTQVGTTVTSALALVLSLLNLYLHRRDRRPRLRIRARYEYRVDASGEEADKDSPPPRIHDDSQEGLYLRLGDFLREYGLDYPQGSPVVRFAVSNEGERAIYLESVKLVLRPNPPFFGDRLVLDPVEDKVIPCELARGTTADIIGQHGGEKLPVELVPGDGVGYKFELTRLGNILRKEGYTGNVRFMLEVADRLGNVFIYPFSVNTDLWAYPKDADRAP